MYLILFFYFGGGTVIVFFVEGWIFVVIAYRSAAAFWLISDDACVTRWMGSLCLVGIGQRV